MCSVPTAEEARIYFFFFFCTPPQLQLRGKWSDGSGSGKHSSAPGNTPVLQGTLQCSRKHSNARDLVPRLPLGTKSGADKWIFTLAAVSPLVFNKRPRACTDMVTSVRSIVYAHDSNPLYFADIPGGPKKTRSEL